MSFHVGQRVVKVRAPFIYAGHPNLPKLVNGRIYTIRDVDHRAVLLGLHDRPTIRLEEIAIPAEDYSDLKGWESGYCPYSFRPLIERKTDISILLALLVPGAKIRETV